MQFFYDGQIRRYLLQTIRVFSNFVVQHNDGTLARIPVLYGDPDKQVATILRQNSENVLNSCPRIAIYISALDIDMARMADRTFVNVTHIRERDIDVESNEYTQTQGKNYTVERLMPTPFKITLKVDIWAASAEQKLQILEQMLVLFNPSIELQTNDNYLDWTSLSVLTLTGINWSSRTIPVGSAVPSPIDIATLTLDIPIWISPPVKVKHMGIITKIISNVFGANSITDNGFIDGLGQPPISTTDTTFSNLLTSVTITPQNYNILVIGNTIKLLPSYIGEFSYDSSLELPVIEDIFIPWEELLGQYPNNYIAGSSCIYLQKVDGTEIVGSISIDSTDSTVLNVTWDNDTFATNTGIDSYGRFEFDPLYNTGVNYRMRNDGTFDAIINPNRTYPNYGISNLQPGDRFLLVEDIAVERWINLNGTVFYASENDIIEWTGEQWNIIFDASINDTIIIYQSNMFTTIQYIWNGKQWAKSYEGIYSNNKWRLIL